MQKAFKRILGWVSATLMSTAIIAGTAPTTVASASTHASTAHGTSRQTTLKIVSSNLYVHHNSYASITIKTNPGAHCTVEVDYKSGPSHAQGLSPQTAGKSGLVTWCWKIGPSTTRGSWSVYVRANGKTVHTYVHVQ